MRKGIFRIFTPLEIKSAFNKRLYIWKIAISQDRLFKVTHIGFLTGLVLCLVLFLCLNLYAFDFFQSRTENKTALDFTLQDLSGRNISLSDFSDKAIVLFFWFTSCPACRGELLNFNKEYENLQSSGIELLAIDIGESKARVERFVNLYSLQYPILLDYDGSVAYKYGVMGVPTIILISKQGNIVSVSHSLPNNYKKLLLK
ncbi:MAG: TlpA family protein disulfide reductase [Candidatus Omnitrophica bacterium]|nr:TlpA family protein disulfide reductase [Candidatus Omnitrophota bacterium]